MSSKVERKLVAVLVADVADYTRLMDSDEDKTTLANQVLEFARQLTD